MSEGMKSVAMRAAEWSGMATSAERAKQANLSALVLDRGPNLYHPGGCLDILVSTVRSAGVKV